MTVSKQGPAEAASPAIHSPAASDPTARPDVRVVDQLADQDLDNVSGGPTAVERNHTPT
jgi:hypothetical protein